MPNFESITTVYLKHNNLVVRQIELENYKKIMIEFIKSHAASFVMLDEQEALHTTTAKKCLENYKTYVMDTVHFEEEYEEIKNSIFQVFKDCRDTVKKQNTIYIQALKSQIYNDHVKNLEKVIL